MFFKLLINTCLLSLLFTSCKELTGEETGAYSESNSLSIGGVSAITSDGHYLMEGTADNGGYSSQNFRIKLNPTLDYDDSSFYFFTGKDTDDGVKISFKKIEEKVSMRIMLNGKSHTHELSGVSAAGPVDLDLDIHNDHTDIHILVWKTGGPYNPYEDCTFEKTCLYNSEDFSFSNWLGVGRAGGVYWKFIGEKKNILLIDGPKKRRTNV